MIPGMNPKQLKQMERQMKKMGMKMEDLQGVKEVIIRFEDKELVIPDADVNVMNVMGQETYQITGTAVEKGINVEIDILAEDIELIASQANVSLEEAENVLKETNGDLAEAILKLSD
ncbi:nascent polypeptide-associated complex protein [Methanobrevibacter curvatus]|uniref:Nascent polypeptide-associated complex protein n=1 Tax=Methanobrevibacter curvatus TaxID=49547 RepID=A0A166CSK4_9EURY|nr:nascent polypeptide-associated complex protein [Methanobrevibacter curvatus]KZX16477.1 nascent polypeptide-associated complex protein [Methanobrevibacter curvatus]